MVGEPLGMMELLSAYSLLYISLSLCNFPRKFSLKETKEDKNFRHKRCIQFAYSKDILKYILISVCT